MNFDAQFPQRGKGAGLQKALVEYAEGDLHRRRAEPPRQGNRIVGNVSRYPNTAKQAFVAQRQEGLPQGVAASAHEVRGGVNE